MKTKLFIVMAALAVALHASESVTTDFETKLLTKYVDQDGFVYYDDAVSQTEITLSVPKGLYLTIWHSRGISGEGMDGEVRDETDYSFGWSGEVGGIAVDIGVTYYDLAPFMKDRVNNVTGPYLELRSSGEGPAVFAKVQAYRTRSGASFEGGTRFSAGIEHSHRLGAATLEHSLTGVYEDGAFGFNKAAVGIYQADLVWGEGKLTLVAPAVTVLHSFSKAVAEQKRTNVVLAVGARYSF